MVIRSCAASIARNHRACLARSDCPLLRRKPGTCHSRRVSSGSSDGSAFLRSVCMPIFMDRHDVWETTAADVAEAHRRDLEVQDRYGVKFLNYWFDQSRSTIFCLCT